MVYYYCTGFIVTVLFSHVCIGQANFSHVPNQENFLLKLKGKISESPCSIEDVNQFNNAKIYPRINSIVVKDYFRFYKVNLKKKCPFWVDSSHCAMRYCQVESCEEKDVPFGITGSKRLNHQIEDMRLKYLESTQDLECEEEHNDLGTINTTISAETLQDFVLWQKYDDVQDLYCMLPDDDGSAQYVDLSFNPERYTGYRGKSAHKIWHVIYKENCFRPENIYDVYIQSSKLSGMCLEKRAFYRAVSGLHTSINIHLCAQYLLSDRKSSMMLGNQGHWGPNVDEFRKKFAPENTDGEGPQWLRNLYFLYLVELRALAKAATYLEQEEYFTGNDKEDVETRYAISDFLNIVSLFPHHFNETVMFSKGQEAKQLKEEFRRHFRNISSIMDCVGCDKCRLWGKLQTQGLGTAFKILFSGKLDKPYISGNNAPSSRKRAFHLERSEIIALFNAFARLSTSIYQLEKFQELMIR